MTGKTEIVFGLHAVRHAIEYSTADILECWIQESKKSSKPLQSIADIARTHGIHVQWVTKPALEKLTDTGLHQGVVVKKRKGRGQSPMDLDTFLARRSDKPVFVLVLDGIQDPHNLGACLRTANAAGVDAVILPKDKAVHITATVNKVASGAVEHTPVIIVTNLARSLEKLQAAGLWVIGTADDAEEELYTIDLKGPLALVLGAEDKGLRLNTRKHCDRLVRIPMLGQVESLNVSVATGIVLFEALRQRTSLSGK